MGKLYYCTECRKIEKDALQCGGCSSEKVKMLRAGDPVNVIGTKQKGKIYHISDEDVKLIIVNEAKEKLIKPVKYHEIQKVL